MRRCRIFLVLILVLMLVFGARAEQPLAAVTVVVYNKTATDSPELARFYAEKRGIASDHIIGLTCSTDEEITREEYDSNIAEPLREVFRARNWWTLRETADQQPVVLTTSIRFVALIKGIPLKIKATAGPYEGDQPAGGPVASRNEASVDSELATLGLFSRHISGALTNPYFQSYKSIAELENPALLLVCRLDAPSAAIVRGMISDSIAAEKNGLWGRAYVDGAHNSAAGFKMGDEWLVDILQQLHKVGVPVVYDDSPAVFPDGYPITDCALYYGWYAGNVAGPFAREDFRFVPGAIAVHIHSFSAASLRDANANWVAPLIAHGAAASLGNVYEPYIQLTSHLNVFNDRLLHGFTFAESAYSSIQVLSWMSVMVGDPLYRPYASWLQIDAVSGSAKMNPWKVYHDFAIQNFSNAPAQYRSLAREAASRARNCPMMEDVGLMEIADGNFASATNYFGQARACYSTRADILRVVMEEADAWNKLKRPKRGLDLLHGALRVAGDAPAAPLLRNLEQQLRATLATPTPGPKAAPRVRPRF
ncbi:MAG TPA: TIGR03790 family protein [Chthoniobacterales bacterium]|nr:TIGR03790 family protein [Chthoniobacterales bacterium]